MRESLSKLFERDLNRVKEEILAYKNEEDLWKLTGDILNPPANLCLHISGNLQHFFGTVLSGSDYKRDRDFEFTGTGVSRQELIDDIDRAKKVVVFALNAMNEDDLLKDFPLQPFGYPMTTEFFVIHLYAHLSWHLGQINYHRRILQLG
mgnify:FL=1